MKQVPLALVPADDGRFETFWPGRNALVLAQLRAEVPPRSPLYLWGERGCGKTHLLQALAHACGQRGGSVGWFDAGDARDWRLDPGCSLVMLDDVQRLDAHAQQSAFALLVEAQSQGVAWAVAADVPPVDLPLRDDLRTRLGWGQVHAVHALSEDETRAALAAEALRRGIVLSPDVQNYLHSRLARDLSSLTRLLARLDRFSLARSRPVTVPLLRAMLAEEKALPDEEGPACG